MCGLCGFLYKDADRVGPVGRTLHALLGSMVRRGIDSTGIALYGTPQPDSYVVRARIDAHHGTPERVAAALDEAGAVVRTSFVFRPESFAAAVVEAMTVASTNGHVSPQGVRH